MPLIKDPKIDPNKMINNADYQVKARDVINNYGAQYGITNDMIGYKNGGKTGTITLGGQDLINPDKVVDGSSWVSNDMLRGAIDNYAKQRGIQSNKYTPEANGYDKDQYSAKIDSILDSVLNAKPFSYDPNTDASFKSYQQQYDRMGNNALANTMSEASSLTGGRLNSWAVSAGNQAKSNYDQQLMDIVPKLEQQAYGRYLGDLETKKSNMNTLLDMDNNLYRRALEGGQFAYGMDQDTLAQTNYQNELALDNQRYTDETAYNRSQDATARADRLKESAADNARQNASLALQQKNYDRNVFESDRDYKLQLEKAAKESGAKPQTLGLIYGEMMSSGDPAAWLASEAPYMTDEELLAIQKLLPKDDAVAKMIAELMAGEPITANKKTHNK